MDTAAIEEARKKILANAKDLVADAELLYRNERFPRAYALAHLAAEEVAKIPMLVRVGVESRLGRRVDWRKVERRLRDHGEKIDGLHTLRYLHDDICPDNSDLTRYRERLEATKAMLGAKNLALYSDRLDGRFVSPGEVITNEMAAGMIAWAREHVEFIEWAETKMGDASIEWAARSPTQRMLYEMMDALSAYEGGNPNGE